MVYGLLRRDTDPPMPRFLARELTTANLLDRLDSDIRPSRMKCVILPLTVLQGALAKETTR